jgi:hypothetical protein
MKSAFNTLEYKSCHANEIASSGIVHAMRYWKEGIENKYLGKGKPYGKPEFEKLLKNYSVRHLHRPYNNQHNFFIFATAKESKHKKGLNGTRNSHAP